MTPLYKAFRRVTVDQYGYGRRRRRLVVALEKGDLITIRELGRRTKHTARLYDVLWWMLRCEADKTRMEKQPDSPSADTVPPNAAYSDIRKIKRPINESRHAHAANSMRPHNEVVFDGFVKGDRGARYLVHRYTKDHRSLSTRQGSVTESFHESVPACLTV